MPAANPTEDGLTRAIGRLNQVYGLGICNLNSRRLAQTDDEKRVDDIYQRIRDLHFTRGDDLSSFGVTSPGPQASTADKGALQCRLLEILSSPPPPTQPKPSKRVSDDSSISPAKRPRSRDKSQLRQGEAVDELPVRTRISPSGSDPPTARIIKSYFPPASTSMQTIGSSQSSFVHSAPSSGHASAQASSCTTLDDDLSDQAADAYPMSNEQLQAFADSFAKYDSRPERHIGSFFNSSAPQKLEERLKCTWPKQLDSSFNEASLAVIWEVTRLLQHCSVQVAEYNLTYDASDERWHTQTALRGMHVNHGPFVGKGLPPASDAEAWTIASKGFQSKVKAVVLSAELVHRSSDTGPFFELRLNPLTLGLGHRLDRRFGADRFLEIIMPSPLTLQKELASSRQYKNCVEKMIRWLAGDTHYFLGRRWRPFFAREFEKTCQSAPGQSQFFPGKSQFLPGKSQYMQKVYFFAADGNIFRMPDACGGVPPLNKPIPKQFARLALSLSRTWPTVVLERHQILCHDKDIGTHEPMNDGVGQMSRSLAKKITAHLGLTDTPSGFQARIGSAKGMWIIDVEDDGLEDKDWIEMYPSQTKWDCAFEDPHHRCFEVKDWSREMRPASLNQQFIPVLEEQALDRGAMRCAIKNHLENGLLADLDAQTAALGDPADLRLWLRQTGGSRTGNVLNGHVPFLAGLPRNEEDMIAYFLDGGIHPRKSKYILDIFFELCKKRAEHLKTKTHVKVPQSTYMLMVADFTSTLEEGEVQVTFSSKFEGGDFSDTLLEDMDVLVGRAPAHLPSDIQRVRAVSHLKLRKLKDVIIFSTKGKRSLADVTSGGDFDGDRAYVCWDRDMVNNFRNAAVPESPDLFAMGYLSKFDLTVAGVGSGAEISGAEMAAKFVFLGLYFNLAKKSLLGQCTKYKERLCYKNNTIGDRAAVILSNLVGHLVDQAKQGTIFEADNWDRLRKDVIRAPKSLDDPDYFGEKVPDHHRIQSGKHILDFLKFQVAENVVQHALKQLSQMIKDQQDARYFDSDLTKKFNSFDERGKTSETCKRLLKDLQHDIAVVSKAWAQEVRQEGKGDYATKVKKLWEMWLEIKPAEELMSSDLVYMLEVGRQTEGDLSQWNLLKASATVKHNHKFAWRMAGRQLCFLKLSQAGVADEKAAAIVHPEMWASLQPNKGFITSRRAQREAAREDDSVAAIEAVMEYDDNGLPVDDA
ncbi:hypothetical protein G6O67_003322 [Ophiocordyceps sinensis]|uniref:RNA-dependent RNA polymerase n=1 Tax=Ophiocordyceps sinensis TaxID=72228 RepID=A0A8H4PW49_9HYPO|nr:hypothetical protein G6O67_003322 [Ophiocordyceps sinensis]